MSLLHWAWVAYWVGALADWHTTRRGLKQGAREIGGLGLHRRLMEWMGRDWAVTLIKGGFFAFLFFAGFPATPVFFMAGMQLLAAAGNHYGWWGPVAHWVRKQWNSLRDRL